MVLLCGLTRTLGVRQFVAFHIALGTAIMLLTFKGSLPNRIS